MEISNSEMVEHAETLQETEPSCSILLAGLGGAGGNIIKAFANRLPQGVRTCALNTDAKALEACGEVERVLFGKKITRGMGTGGSVDTGLQVVEDERPQLDKLLGGVDLVISFTGLGGGAGTALLDGLASAAVRADVAHLAFAIQPFTFEGKARAEVAETFLGKVRNKVHGLVALPNDLILQLGDEDLSAEDAFAEANRWIIQAVRSICLMIQTAGLINQDLQSLLATLNERGGRTLFAVGGGAGTSSVADLLQSLIDCPLLEVADGKLRCDQLLVQITGGKRLGLAKVNQIISRLGDYFECREDIRFGASIDAQMEDAIDITLIGKIDLRTRVHAPSDDTGTLNLGVLDHQEPAPKGANEPTRPDRPVYTSKLSRKERKEGTQQEEFEFLSAEAQRGLFEKTERNLYQGEDLDVPTFLRKGIQIKA